MSSLVSLPFCVLRRGMAVLMASMHRPDVCPTFALDFVRLQCCCGVVGAATGEVCNWNGMAVSLYGDGSGSDPNSPIPSTAFFHTARTLMIHDGSSAITAVVRCSLNYQNYIVSGNGRPRLTHVDVFFCLAPLYWL